MQHLNAVACQLVLRGQLYPCLLVVWYLINYYPVALRFCALVYRQTVLPFQVEVVNCHSPLWKSELGGVGLGLLLALR